MDVLILYTILFFFILTPSLFFKVPPNGDKYTVALVHSIIFGIAIYLIDFLKSKAKGVYTF
jgi:hypothetical protein